MISVWIRKLVSLDYKKSTLDMTFLYSESLANILMLYFTCVFICLHVGVSLSF